MVHFLGFHAHYTIEFDKDLINEIIQLHLTRV